MSDPSPLSRRPDTIRAATPPRGSLRGRPVSPSATSALPKGSDPTGRCTSDAVGQVSGNTSQTREPCAAVQDEVARWRISHRHVAAEYAPTRLAERKGKTTVTVIIPTKHCAATITGILHQTVGPLADLGLVDHVLVVDAQSPDGTAERAATAGATVVQQDELLTEHGLAMGKGDAMWRALHATRGDIICFLDGDTADPHPDHLLGLLGPLLCDPSLQLVKGAFDRPLRTGDHFLPDEGGRVTELMARPLLNLYEPALAGFAQPLAGEFSALRELLEAIPFPTGYGVEIAILIDALRRHGLGALAECHLGTRQNRHQPLRALGEMAYAVLAAVRARTGDNQVAITGKYLRPWDDLSNARVPVLERPPLRELDRLPSFRLPAAGLKSEAKARSDGDDHPHRRAEFVWEVAAGGDLERGGQNVA